MDSKKRLNGETPEPNKRGVTSGGDHTLIAKRFMRFCDALDAVEATYQRQVPERQPQSDYPLPVDGESYLVTHLKYLVRTWTSGARSETRTGDTHAVMKLQGKDGRRTLPKLLSNALGERYEHRKVEAKWIVCYLHNVRPDQTKADWEHFECSHRCIENGLRSAGVTCISHECLCWESKSCNQSRGNSFCTQLCCHEGCNLSLCACQRIHIPACK